MIFNHMEWHNVAEVVHFNQKDIWCRVPDTVRLELNSLAQRTAFCTSGSEIRFRMHSEEIRLRLELASEEPLSSGAAIVEIYHGCFPEPEPRIWSGKVIELVIKKPAKLALLSAVAKRERAAFSPEIVRVLLPINANVTFVDLDGHISAPRPEDKPAHRWLAYGSSITHGASAGLPGGTYAMRAAAKLKVDLLNLGFPGSGMLDDAIAAYIAGRDDWHVATLELGINVKWDVIRNGPTPIEVFREKLDRFLPVIANAHPDKWIFCIDMFAMQGDYDGDPLVEPYRKAVRDKVREINLPKLVHLNGLDLLPDGLGLTSDLIHPSDSGMERIAEQLAAKMSGYMDII